ncbi:MAG: transposase [Leptospiraceae bacterium]|nr:transposase [Leptospiraceae bacterium]
MKDVKNFVGVDISSEYFTVSIFRERDKKLISFENFENSDNGFQSLLAEFQSHRFDFVNTAICMEATGVYGESLIAFLVARGYSVAVENPYKVKRAFDVSPKKSDKIDSGKLAEYAYRFYDQLHFWTPKPQIIEEISIFLAQREQFTKQKISISNALHSLQRKKVQSLKAISLYESMIKNCEVNIKTIDKEIEMLIQKDPEYKQMVENLKTVPGVGNMLANHLLVVTNGFRVCCEIKNLYTNY